MRERFLGHFKETNDSVSEIWNTAVFVFDANVLLNLYRYSDATRNDFLKLLAQHKERSWMPEQAAFEFLQNRPSVIREQINSYQTAISNFGKLRDSFSGWRGHPFVSKDIKAEFDSTFEKVTKDLTTTKAAQEKLIYEDPIKEQVADLFEGRVGDAYSSQELADLFTEGKDRYEAKIPPGYRDGAKNPNPKNESESRSNFGDLIIWKQVMQYAQSNQTPIIFVTDDRKDDWWEEQSGKTLGPQPELIKEFYDTCKQKILFYKPENFLTQVQEKLNSSVSKKSLEEIKEEHILREQKYENHFKFRSPSSYLSEIDPDGFRRSSLRRRSLVNHLSDPNYPRDGSNESYDEFDISQDSKKESIRSLFTAKIRKLMYERESILIEMETLNHARFKLDHDKDQEEEQQLMLRGYEMAQRLELITNRISEFQDRLDQIS